MTAWDYHHVDLGMVHGFGDGLPSRESGWVRDLLEIRAGRGLLLHDMSGSGLTAFPSYHCVAGILFVWALWPVRSVRGPMMIASIALIAAAPIYGGHYLADLFGGAGVALVSAIAAERLEQLWHGGRGSALGTGATAFPLHPAVDH